MATFRKPTNRSDLTTAAMKLMNENAGGALSRFVDNAQPMKVRYYRINKRYSMLGTGAQDTAGPYDGGIKYDVIHDYVLYGYTEERSVDVEKGEHLNASWRLDNLTFLNLPNTLKPSPDDRLSLEVEDHRYLYRVVKSVPVTFVNKPYIRIEVAKCNVKPFDYYLEDFKRDGLIINEFNYVEDNVGTKESPFMSSDTLDSINKIDEVINDFIENYNDFFYQEYSNTYLATDPKRFGTYAYSPLMVDLQMEFRPLYVFGINTILTHETVVNRRSRANYKKNPIRRFLLKKPGALEKLKEGVLFTPYLYTSSIMHPLFKIGSYLNDDNDYLIYDYYGGENVFYSDEGDVLLKMSIEYLLEVPEDIMYIFEKYYNDTLTYDELIDYIEDEYELDYDFKSMLFGFMLLVILNNIKNTLSSKDKIKLE